MVADGFPTHRRLGGIAPCLWAKENGWAEGRYWIVDPTTFAFPCGGGARIFTLLCV